MENKGYVNYGEHIGDVKFNGFIKPPQGHKNAVHCPECENLTWRHSLHCVCCGYEVKEHFYQKEVAINIEIVRRGLLWKLAFFLGVVVFLLADGSSRFANIHALVFDAGTGFNC